MKKWHIMLIVGILIVGIFTMLGIVVYKYYIVPRHIEPIVEKIDEYITQDDIIDELYAEAETLHDNGIIEDSTYADFVRAYNEYKRDDIEFGKRVLAENEAKEDVNADNSTKLSTKYASHKVGMEAIQVNESDTGGKADVKYSDERTSDRVKAEDVVEAEKIIKDAEEQEKSTASPSPTPDSVQSAYDKLRKNMSADEFATFTRIMRKLDISALKANITNKAALKEYLTANLTNEEYSEAVNLGYKYIHIFMKK